MSALLVELEQQATTLLPDECAHLAEVLLESLRDTSLADIEAEWEHEIENRVKLKCQSSDNFLSVCR